MIETILALILMLFMFGITVLMYSRKSDIKLYITITVVFAFLINTLSLQYEYIPFRPYIQAFFSIVELLMLYYAYR